jgi:hypothetical protein
MVLSFDLFSLVFLFFGGDCFMENCIHVPNFHGLIVRSLRIIEFDSSSTCNYYVHIVKTEFSIRYVPIMPSNITNFP